ncbi:hypothetical protein KCV05_g37, partial [Aureobasidium melanogenum]
MVPSSLHREDPVDFVRKEMMIPIDGYLLTTICPQRYFTPRKFVRDCNSDDAVSDERQDISERRSSEGQLEMPRQNKVRKGTHSCWECRRRKVKCVFGSPTDARCITCQRRDSICTSQSSDSPVNTLQNRRYAQGLHSQMVRETDHDRDVQSATPTEVLHGSTTSEFGATGKTPLSTLHRKPETYIVKPNLLSPESDPVLLAKQMLLFATALRYISPTEQICGLSKHHHQIMEELAGTAIKLVTTNESLLGSLECLESIILEAFYHTDSGDIRKAWITMRRAVMAAQLLGLHRRGHCRYKVIDDRNVVDPETIWSSIVYMERVVSLLSGLPTSTDNIILIRKGAADNTSNDCGLLTDLGNVAGKILERNQIELPQLALDITKNIDDELLRISTNLSPAFWRPTGFSGLAQDSSHAFDEIRRVFDHSSYYTLVIQLHMPHMLCPSHSTQRMYSKMACVNASREILTRQIAHDIDAGTCYKSLRHNSRQRAGASTARRSGDGKPTRSQMCFVAQRLGNANDGEDRDFVITRAPFFGGIKLSRGGVATVNPSRSEQNQSSSEAISIGGIGSIRVNTPSSNGLAPANVTSELTISEPLQSQQEFTMQPDQILSDIAFDDCLLYSSLFTADFSLSFYRMRDQGMTETR